MAAFSIRGLDDRVADALKERARANGRSFEAEVRGILSEAVRARPPLPKGLQEALAQLTPEEARRAMIPARNPRRVRPRPIPVELDGPPLSDTVIEDRR